MDAKKEVSALGYSIAANINGDRQITFQHFIASDATDAEVNADMDRIMRIVDRQQAIYQIPSLEEERGQLLGQIAQSEKDLEALNAEYEAWEAEQNKLISTLKIEQEAVQKRAYNEHVANSRRGQFELRGASRAQYEAYERDIGKIVESMIAKAQEKGAGESNLRANNAHRQNRIATIDEKIAELKQKVG